MKRSTSVLHKALTLLLCAALLVCGISCGPAGSVSAAGEPGPDTGEAATLYSDERIQTAGDYGQIYEAVKALADRNKTGFLEKLWNRVANFSGADTAVMEAEAPMAVEDAAAAENGGTAEVAPAEGGGESDHSLTNSQVSGIDEGDIVKTDGESIYILRDGRLIIVSARGGESRVLSTTQVARDGGEYDIMPLAEPRAEAAVEENVSEYAQELYLCEDRLVVLLSRTQWRPYEESTGGAVADLDIAWFGRESVQCRAVIYDVSDPSAPQEVADLGQDGYYSSSRLMDGVLYLISNYDIYEEPREDEPATYVPQVYTQGEARAVEASEVCICPAFESVHYMVVSAIDVASAERLSTCSVLGSSDTIYMSAENLYTASTRYESQQSQPYTQDRYTVVDYTEKQTTEILRFSLTDGVVRAAASGVIPGVLLNQFALDEYQGHLRAVTTIQDNSYRIFTDEDYGWTNYQWGDGAQSNALWVLDGQLETVGSIEGLGEDEQVYSVRFDGATGYFVTFRQTDPLFAVDLADPTAPKVLSALKIPGFSQYLHVYTPGRLLGLGMDADQETGITGSMKLSMFNVEDPANVTEKHTLLLGSSYSAALYNHKAILISAAKDLIAFPAEGGYDVYGYSDERGFYLRGSFDAGEWYYDARGLYAGDYIYICGYDSLTVVNLADLTPVTTLRLF
ncbi:MAG: beta-propeller domain-containing protein [Bacillota bacterium]|nr:beta-propeller domain-containing protein [Bacillota bacterium]